MIIIPYLRKSGSFEHAKGIGHVPIIKNEFVQKELEDFQLAFTEKIEEIPKDLLFFLGDEIDKQNLPEYIFSFDGSATEVEVDERFPSTKIEYLQIAAILILLDEMLEQNKSIFVNPSKIMDMIKDSLQSMVFPGSNICKKKCSNLIDSWRIGIYEKFCDYEIEDLKLIDIYMNLIMYSPDHFRNDNIFLTKCSTTNKCQINIKVPKEGTDCPTCHQKLFPTDILRIHEEVQDAQSNTGPLNRTMTLLEHLYMVGYLHFLIERRPDTLSKIAFIIDGPLAIFGPQAWIHRAIQNFLDQEIYKTLEKKNLNFPLILGIEKTGSFAEHAEIISKFLKPQTIMILTEDYIYKYILSSKPLSGEYGSETYYGQKFFYKTKKNQILTVSIPRREKGPFTKEIIKNPSLLRVLHLLDNIGTILYKDALIPIALAHSFASIPLKTGSKVLKILTKEKLNL